MNMHANPVGTTKDIYKITNNINGKIYIGQAKDSKKRFSSHCKQSDCLIDLAIKKYGKENFSMEIIESQIENYNEREKFWIKQLKSKVPNGYNISDGGEEPPIFYGIQHPTASIKTQEKLEQIILSLIETKKSYFEIAQEFGTNKKTVLGINHGFRYFNPSLSYPLRKNPNINGKLTNEDVENIIEELKYSYDSNTNIGLKYGVSEHTIRNINSGLAHHKKNILYPIRPVNAVRSKVSYDQLIEIANLLKNTKISIREIAKQYKIDKSVVDNINKGSKIYFRREFIYPLRLPPHKKYF